MILETSTALLTINVDSPKSNNATLKMFMKSMKLEKDTLFHQDYITGTLMGPIQVLMMLLAGKGMIELKVLDQKNGTE